MVVSKNNERNLIRRAKNGDESAVAELYELHVDKIYRYIAFRVPDSEVDDLTADVFIRMIEGIPNFTYTGVPFEAWLYKIASARVADFHRRRGREADDVPEDVVDTAPQPEAFLQKKQEWKRVRKALQQLSSEEQTILILRFVEQRTHRQVAKVLGKSEAAVRTMQHRALHKLGELLDATGKERHYIRGEKRPQPEISKL